MEIFDNTIFKYHNFILFYPRGVLNDAINTTQLDTGQLY